MKKVTLVSFMFTAVAVVFSFGCMDRQPAPVCPVPIELGAENVALTGFEGVDLLVVVDNSGSMEEEQEILATGFFTLINALVNPVDISAGKADNVHVAVVSSDMGLQWSGNDGPAPTQVGGVSGCAARGDDGKFHGYAQGTPVNIQNNVIACAPDAAQCPTGWSCVNSLCQAPGGSDGTGEICPALPTPWAETSAESRNPNLAFQVACMSKLGKEGCGIEQQLEAAVAGAKFRKAEFIRENYLLAVLVVSDEEDCSISSRDIFATDQWTNQETLNTACNYSPSDSDHESKFLHPTTRYKQQFGIIKGTADSPKYNAVVFAAIVGVPQNDDCQGDGGSLSGCLGQEAMKLKVNSFTDAASGQDYNHFEPACKRGTVTEARPGRRYVQVAQDFGSRGYVYSICNADWSPAMTDIAKLIADNLAGACFGKSLDWDPVEKVAKCDVVVEFRHTDGKENHACPTAFQDAWTASGDKPEVLRELEYDQDGEILAEKVFCPLPKIKADKSCEVAEAANVDGQFGWYYCEDSRENSKAACTDKVDNDGNGKIDGDDPSCQACLSSDGSGCTKSCPNKVEITALADKASENSEQISVQCLQRFNFEDENCQENTFDSCTNGQDEDGNGLWDCDFEEGVHDADPNCCPMADDVASGSPCVFLKDGNGKERFKSNCGSDNPSQIGACLRAAADLKCDLP